MRTLQVIKSLGRGGAEMLLAATQGPLRDAGVECDYLYFLPWKNQLVNELESGGGAVRLLSARTSLGVVAAAPRLAGRLRAGDYDLVHAHLPIAGVAARLAGAWSRTPVVYTEHNLQERYRRPTRLLNALTWRRQAGVVAVSDEVARSIRRHRGDDVPVQVIRNGVPTDRFRPGGFDGSAARRELGIPSDSPLIGTVAVFRIQKRLDRWLDSADLICRQVEDAHFLIVGDGPLADEVRAWIEQRQLTDRVHLCGLQEDVRPYLAAMDLYLISSDFEGLPVALLEALAMEIPVVSVAVGGIPEVLEGGGGRIATTSEPSTLAGECIELLRDPGALVKIGRRGREIVEERYSVSRMVRDLAAYYRQLLDGA